MLAPIVLFVYNRPFHTQLTVEALQQNTYASASELFIYSDGAKGCGDVEDVEKVRKYIRKVNGFAKVTIVESLENKGLASSIIDGVTDIINRYGKVIVLEDDIVTGSYFLTFMNEALNHYKDESRVWHISGWNYPIDSSGLGDTFFWRGMNCWGWATWADRWQYFDRDVDKVVASFDSKKKRKAFDLEGVTRFWRQIHRNKNGSLRTWAIFWYATIFNKHGLCLNPTQSLVVNIGHDNSGTNCGKTDVYSTDLKDCNRVNLDAELVESTLALKRIKRFYKRQRVFLLMRFLKGQKRGS